MRLGRHRRRPAADTRGTRPAATDREHNDPADEQRARGNERRSRQLGNIDDRPQEIVIAAGQEAEHAGRNLVGARRI
jgi:hypothetical protein